MPNTTVNAIVLKVTCGSVLNTTINGVAIQIECQPPAPTADEEPWPPPVSSGGVVALRLIDAPDGLLDLNRVIDAFHADGLEGEAEPMADAEAALVVFEAPDGSLASLDALIVVDEDE